MHLNKDVLIVNLCVLGALEVSKYNKSVTNVTYYISQMLNRIQRCS